MKRKVNQLKFAFAFLFFGTINVCAQQVIKDVNYSKRNAPICQLDLYIPANSVKFPVLVFLHEGSLIKGDKTENRLPEIAQKFQADGIAVALVNYSLAPELWPAQPDDVCEAFAWVKKNIAKYGGDAGRVFIAGHSSGAFLAAIVSTDPVYMAKQGFTLKDIAGAVMIGTQLKAVLPAVSDSKLEGYFKTNEYLKIFQTRQIYENASPMAHVNENIPPMRFIIADAEQFNPPILEQTEGFIEKLKPWHKDAKYYIISNRTHMEAATKMADAGDSVYQIIKDFIQLGK